MDTYRWMGAVVIIALVYNVAHGQEQKAERLERLRKKVLAVEFESFKENYLANLRAADEVIEESEDLLPADSPTLANYLEIAADVYRHTFRNDDLDRLLNRVLEIRVQALKKEATSEMEILVASSLYQIGQHAARRDDLSRSNQKYKQAMAAIEAVKPTLDQRQVKDHIEVFILNGMARNLAGAGDYGASLPLFARAVACGEKLDPAEPWSLAQVRCDYAEALLNRAAQWQYWNEGKHADADLNEAMKQLKAAGQQYFGKKQMTYERQLEFLKVLRNQNRVLFAYGKHSQVEQSLQRILDNTKQLLGDHVLAAQLKSDLARVKFTLGKYAEARKEYEGALEVLGQNRKRFATRFEIARIKTELAKVIATGDRAQRNDSIHLARQALHEHLSDLEHGFDHKTDRQRLLALFPVREAVNVYLSLMFTEGAPRGQAEALATYADVLDWKGVVFGRSAFERGLRLASKSDAQRLTTMREAYLSARQSYRQFAMAPVPAGVAKDQWEAKEEAFRILQDKLQKELSGEIDRLAPAAEQANPSPEDVAASLQKGVVLADFVVYDHLVPPRAGTGLKTTEARIVVYLSRKGHNVACVELGALSALSEPLEKWFKTLNADGDTDPRLIPDLDGHASAISKSVWKPIADHPYLRGADKIILSPDSILWRVPFAALPGSARHRRLVEDLPLSYALSGRQVFEMGRRKGFYAVPSGSICLVVGAIEHGKANGDDGIRKIEVGNSWIDEMNAAHLKIFPKGRLEVVKERAATAANLLPLFGAGLSEVHFFGHGPISNVAKISDWTMGLGRVRMPLAQSNLDSPANEWQNSPEAEEMSTIDMRGVKTFWWWGCSVNSGPALSGEGVIGMPRALHLAGCQSVLASQWNTRPDVAKRISARVRTLVWSEGKRPAEALWQAQREFLEDDQGEGRHPSYWAPWIIIGDAEPYEPTMGDRRDADAAKKRKDAEGAEKQANVEPAFSNPVALWAGGGVVVVVLLLIGIILRLRRKT